MLTQSMSPTQQNNVKFNSNQLPPPPNSKTNTAQPQNNIKKDGKKKLALALTALSVVAIAGVAIYKSKGTKLSNIDFDKGMAYSKNGNKFTGKIKDKLTNGDKIVMEYTDGILQKSTRSGKVNFEKVYENVNNERIVKKTVNGVTTEFNITKAQQEVKSTQEKLKSVLDSQTNEIIEDASKVVDEFEQKSTQIPETKKAAETVAEKSKITEDASKVVDEPAQNPTQIPKAETTAKQAVNKLSGNADERLAALKNNDDNEYYTKLLESMTPEELKAFKRLNPKILEKIGDYPLACYLNGDVEEITTVLNGISSDTLEALNDRGIGVETLACGLASAGKKPTAEDVLKKFEQQFSGFEFDPANIDIDKLLQSEMQNYKSQFTRVKLLDTIFTPDGIKSLSDNSIDNLCIWLRGDMAYKPFDAKDHIFLDHFYDALNKEFKVDNYMSKIEQIAQQL